VSIFALTDSSRSRSPSALHRLGKLIDKKIAEDFDAFWSRPPGGVTQ